MKAKIFAFLEICFLIGAIAPSFFENDPKWFASGIAIAAASLLLIKFNKFWFVLFGIGLLLISLGRFYDRQDKYEQINKNLSVQEQIYSGTVVDMPVKKEFNTEITVKLSQKDEKIIGYTNASNIAFGNTVSFKGKVKSYAKSKNFLIKEGIAGELTAKDLKVTGQDKSLGIQAKNLLFRLRTRFNQGLKEVLPENEAGLASGLILGEKQYLSPEFVRELQGSGTSHIIALSGYNITIIIGLFALFYPYFSRRINLLLPIVFIACFVVMTGGSASVIRASIMGIIPLVARFLGRSSDSFLAILFSAFIMVLINPYILLYDVGFQLSFAALAGMIYLAPYIEKLLRYWPGILRKIFAETVGAQVGVLPLILYYFGYISIISPISNLCILMLVPFAMLAAFLVGLAQLFFPLINTVLVFPAYFVLHGIMYLIEFFGNLPFATVQQKVNQPYIVALVYLLFIDLLFLIKNRERRKRFEESI